MRKVDVWIVLVGLVLLGILTYGVWYTVEDRTLQTRQHEPSIATAVEVDDSLTSQELFELGEYYFNHDDDPAGPYDIAAAKRYYEAAIKKDPLANEIAWYQYGRIDFIQGNFNSALYKFEKQRSLFPELTISVDYMVGLTYGYKARRSGNSEDWQKGAEAFERFIEFEPYAPWPRIDLAWIYFAQGKFEEMKPTLEKGLEYEPDNAWLLNMYGLALLNTDDIPGARVQFERAAAAAEKLTPEDWGKSYPGNDPADWEQGLREFQAAIDKNLNITVSREGNE